MKVKLKQNLFLSPKIQVRTSDIGGRGVFCNEDIKKGELVEEAHMILLNNNRWEDCDSELSRYVLPWIELRDDWEDFCEQNEGVTNFHVSRPVVILGFGMIYNHNDKNSLDYYINKRSFFCSYTANRDIPKGSELTINYGDQYFKNIDIEKK
tara:strand:- start:380 stop:835 length:456 start_codon:yes stop_codon:yes gene_type:complete